MSVTLGMILEARERLKGVAQRTGLVQFKALTDERTQVYLKTEDLQNTGSFKVRGAYIKIASLSDEERACGVIASSAGNHAQGVALAAKTFGIPATIVMPAGAPQKTRSKASWVTKRRFSLERSKSIGSQSSPAALTLLHSRR